MNARPALILASNSPRRKDLLTLAGLPFEIVAADINETPREGEPPRDYVRRLAEEKAVAASLRADASQVILAADTIVVDGDTLLGKPADPSEAKRMLLQLRGRVHQVYTGLAALRVSDGHILRDVCAADVQMREYSEAEIDAYIATGDPLDKAGAYAIQHPTFKPVASTTGCYAGVMGLPICHVTRLLWHMDIPIANDVHADCNDRLDYHCALFKDILGPYPGE